MLMKLLPSTLRRGAEEDAEASTTSWKTPLRVELAVDSGGAAADEFFDFGKVCHGGVAGGGHG